MKLAIMQPYFFPYLGYFDLINRVDLFVVYDVAQYPKQGWVNRNRILQKANGWEYITVPLEKASFSESYRTPISQICVSRSVSWREDLAQKLRRYSRHAPHFKSVMTVFEHALAPNDPHICRIDVTGLEVACEILDITFEYQLASEFDFQFSSDQTAQQKVLHFCSELGADSYLNLAGGKDLYQPSAFEDRGIHLTFLDTPEFCYEAHGFNFEPNLSIIDVMMWNSPKKIHDFLNRAIEQPSV